MKKLSTVIASLFFLLLSFGAYAQEKKGADYFEGKWNVLVKGTPNGDTKMFVLLQKKEGTLTGTVQDSTGKELSQISSVELKDNSLTVFFSASGYDVNLLMDKKDEDHFKGSLMGMFEAEGDRVKAITK